MLCGGWWGGIFFFLLLLFVVGVSLKEIKMLVGIMFGSCDLVDDVGQD